MLLFLVSLEVVSVHKIEFYCINSTVQMYTKKISHLENLRILVKIYEQIIKNLIIK